MSHDINRLWHKARGKEDPYLKIGEENIRDSKGNSDYVWALKDINFDIEQGDRVGIIGRNGAGKSTLLKILSRTTSPTTGSVKIKGKVASLLEVGTGFHPDLSGRDNIFLNGAILGMTKRDIKSRFDEIVDFAGVERYIDTPVKRYSSGMYVRLAFAVAAYLESDILIVDEVLAVGDAEFQKKCLGKMGEVSINQGKTILFVSHNLDAISNLTLNAIYMINGKIELADNTSKVLAKYMNSGRTDSIVYQSSKNLLTPHIRKIELITSLPNNVQYHNDEMKVRIEIFTPKTIRGASFSFKIMDSKERSFIHQWIFDIDIAYCREKGSYELLCVIPELKLYMGKYFLRCYFTEPPGGEIFEVVDFASPFEVIMYKTKRSLFSWYPEDCAYLEKSNWSANKL